MIRQYFIILFIFFAYLIVQAQENCTNGIDDDGDSFIDLNDEDCVCVELENLVPNGDFEEYDMLPVGPNRIHASNSWLRCCTENGSMTSIADYNHLDAYYRTSFSIPYPSGKGFASSFYNFIEMPIITNPPANFPNYDLAKREFFGTNLSETLVANTDYNFSMFMHHEGTGEDNLFELEFIVYGKSSQMEEYEINFGYCPGQIDNEWVEIIKLPYNPTHSWEKLSTNFRLNSNVEAIIIGISCNVPGAYYNIEGSKRFGFDNITISAINSEFMLNSNGAYCSNNLTLNAVNSNDFIPESYQWYYNGAAIEGAINNYFSITENSEEGLYAVRAINSTGCRNSLDYNFRIPTYDFEVELEIDDLKRKLNFNLNSNQNFTYSIDGQNFQSNTFFSDIIPGDHILYIKNQDGCLIKEIPFAVFQLYNVFTPNGDGLNDTWNIKGIQNYPGSLIRIFDRYGVEKLNYKIPENLTEFKWDGKIKGTPLSSGTYYYLISIKDGRSINGAVTIKKK